MKVTFINNIFINKEGLMDNILMESDYANVKNLYEELSYLVKLQDSSR
jgi:hypothetical protein